MTYHATLLKFPRTMTRLSLAVLAAAFVLPAHAQDLDVTVIKSSAINPYQIAIVPFVNDNGITNVINSNLNFTELKANSSNLPARPMSAADFMANRVLWQQAGYNFVVVGAAQSLGNGKAQINYEIIDVNTGGTIGGRQSQLADAHANGYRYAAHVISDKIYELLTGNPGDFSGRIAFIEETGDPRNKTSALKVMDADGQNVRTLYTVQGSIFGPTWSPDGKRLAYSVQRPNGLPVIYVQSADAGGQQLVTPHKGNNLGPSFSPDGSNLLFSGSHENNDPAVYQLHIPSGNLRKLTNMNGAENSPNYAPDGRSFVFTADGGSRTPQLYRYSFGTGQAQRISGAATNQRYSPDGSKIAYVSGSSLVVMNAAGGGIQNIGSTGMHESATFSPSSMRIVYSSYQGGRGVLTIRHLGTGQSASFSTQGRVREPAWSPARNVR